MRTACREPSEMTPKERLDEVARLLARGVVRLWRRLPATGEPSSPSPLPDLENKVFLSEEMT